MIVGMSGDSASLGPTAGVVLSRKVVHGHLGWRNAGVGTLARQVATGRLDLSRPVSAIIPSPRCTPEFARWRPGKVTSSEFFSSPIDLNLPAPERSVVSVGPFGREICSCEGYFTRQPASIGKATPVTYRPSSDARYSSALLTSIGSTHGTGRTCMLCETGAKSFWVGFSSSGRNSR